MVLPREDGTPAHRCKRGGFDGAKRVGPAHTGLPGRVPPLPFSPYAPIRAGYVMVMLTKMSSEIMIVVEDGSSGGSRGRLDRGVVGNDTSKVVKSSPWMISHLYYLPSRRDDGWCTGGWAYGRGSIGSFGHRWVRSCSMGSHSASRGSHYGMLQ